MKKYFEMYSDPRAYPITVPNAEPSTPILNTPIMMKLIAILDMFAISNAWKGKFGYPSEAQNNLKSIYNR